MVRLAWLAGAAALAAVAAVSPVEGMTTCADCDRLLTLLRDLAPHQFPDTPGLPHGIKRAADAELCTHAAAAAPDAVLAGACRSVVHNYGLDVAVAVAHDTPMALCEHVTTCARAVAEASVKQSPAVAYTALIAEAQGVAHRGGAHTHAHAHAHAHAQSGTHARLRETLDLKADTGALTMAATRMLAQQAMMMRELQATRAHLSTLEKTAEQAKQTAQVAAAAAAQAPLLASRPDPAQRGRDFWYMQQMMRPGIHCKDPDDIACFMSQYSDANMMGASTPPGAVLARLRANQIVSTSGGI